eukprot:3138050-Prymnesium_polylepis.1
MTAWFSRPSCSAVVPADPSTPGRGILREHEPSAANFSAKESLVASLAQPVAVVRCTSRVESQVVGKIKRSERRVVCERINQGRGSLISHHIECQAQRKKLGVALEPLCKPRRAKICDKIVLEIKVHKRRALAPQSISEPAGAAVTASDTDEEQALQRRGHPCNLKRLTDRCDASVAKVTEAQLERRESLERRQHAGEGAPRVLACTHAVKANRSELVG